MLNRMMPVVVILVICGIAAWFAWPESSTVREDFQVHQGIEWEDGRTLYYVSYTEDGVTRYGVEERIEDDWSPVDVVEVMQQNDYLGQEMAVWIQVGPNVPAPVPSDAFGRIHDEVSR